MIFVAALIVAAVIAFFDRGRDGDTTGPIGRALASGWAPLVVGVVSAGVLWWTWGRLQPPPVFHDEISYLLQARLFVEGRWTAPSPPMPDMFAQAHVIVAPVMASKYPPGHSLLLALGALFGAPAIVVIALGGLRFGMTFALARRLTDGHVALVTCLGLLHGDSLRWGASYFSETTTGALLLVGWYALARWHDGHGRRWLTLVALALGWCAITRPYSAVLFAVPIGWVVLRRVVATRSWRDLALAVAVGSAVTAVIPLWSARTTGDWRLWPATVYARDYMPFDRPHFGVDSTLPRRSLPGDLEALIPSLRSVERVHTVANLPTIASRRIAAFANATWQVPLPQAALALVGFATAPAAAWVGVVTAATLFAGYLAHPTWTRWTIYYMEASPVLVFLAVCGIAAMLRGLARAPGARTLFHAPARGSRAFALVGVVILLYAQHDVRLVRHLEADHRAYQEDFRRTLSSVPAPAILFVRHAPWHIADLSLITNGPDWPDAPVWVVADGGPARDSALLRMAPTRRAFIYDEAHSRVEPYVPPATARTQ